MEAFRVYACVLRKVWYLKCTHWSPPLRFVAVSLPLVVDLSFICWPLLAVARQLCVLCFLSHCAHTHTHTLVSWRVREDRCLQVAVYLFVPNLSYEEGFSRRLHTHTLTRTQTRLKNKVRRKTRLWTWQIGTPCSCDGDVITVSPSKPI